eukprot:3967469-Amphidinium_carterae.1
MTFFEIPFSSVLFCSLKHYEYVTEEQNVMIRRAAEEKFEREFSRADEVEALRAAREEREVANATRSMQLWAATLRPALCPHMEETGPLTPSVLPSPETGTEGMSVSAEVHPGLFASPESDASVAVPPVPDPYPETEQTSVTEKTISVAS